MPTFAWTPDYHCQVENAPRVREAKFGDGYRQSVEDGINIDPKVWRLTFGVRSNAEMAAVVAFLKAQGAASFDWTDPDGEAMKAVCRSRSRGLDNYNNNTLTATFEQVFGE